MWRATDTTLIRQVAITILPDVFAADPERVAKTLVLGDGNYDVAQNGERFVIVSDLADRPAPSSS